MALQWTIRISKGEDEGRVFVLSKASITVGRTRGFILISGEPKASGSHAEISYDRATAGYLLKDLESSNGTLVNGVKVMMRALVNGDRIGIGDTELTFERESQGGSKSAPAKKNKKGSHISVAGVSRKARRKNGSLTYPVVIVSVLALAYLAQSRGMWDPKSLAAIPSRLTALAGLGGVAVTPEACRDDARKCVELAENFAHGNGVPQSPERALQYFAQACVGGVARGCDAIARIYLEGTGVPRSPEKATQIWAGCCQKLQDSECCRHAGGKN